VIVAHLGNGASLCALRGGRSVATTMGFTPLDGLVMGTRPGRLDPGVLLWLMTEEGMDAGAISDLLYRRSGLLGLSGLSNDMRVLEAARTPEAEEAIAVFVAAIRREIGGLAAVLGGVDAIVFTAGIGENSVRVRAEVCAGLGWLGLHFDAAANAALAREISAPGSALRALVIPTDEEAVIAAETAARAGLA
jgi:acetate kinase